MRALTAPDIIHVWERGQDRHAFDRALLLLAPAFPELSWDELATLTVGQRNTCLFVLRSRTFGFALRARADCPRCACRLEFSLDARNLCRADRMAQIEAEQLLNYDDVAVLFRPLDSRDLAAVVHSEDVPTARALLIESCVLAARADEQTVGASELTESVATALAERAAAGDPHAETLLALSCQDCAHEWSTLFDIASFFWTEISAEAKRLLYEVQTLARTFGWTEQDILAMSAARRQIYLEMTS